MVLCNLMQPAFSVFRLFVSVLSHWFDGTISNLVPLDYSVCGSSALVAWDGIDDLTRYEAAFFWPPNLRCVLLPGSTYLQCVGRFTGMGCSWHKEWSLVDVYK